MNRGLSRAFALSILTVTFASTPALADKGSGSDYFGGRDRGAEHAGDRGGDRGHEGGGSHDEGGSGGHEGGGHSGGGGGSRGTPAPIAGLGLLAFGAIGYGLRKLRK
ncbi:hypothetical protein [Sphingomonas oligoaromativorans]|uniref:hypothetical protein n=1 Tax=Sphingomonas oligoaromativorans TaxID=575322 RepID=UPI001422078D|nr:hypothetical protein [Sphingomonas oligoaromativorans]NIJ32436.1 hypothetical protein [Sphingomonas oligoaromativorans]